MKLIVVSLTQLVKSALLDGTTGNEEVTYDICREMKLSETVRESVRKSSEGLWRNATCACMWNWWYKW